MNRFIGIIRYEYRMSIHRWGFWLAFGLLGFFTASNRIGMFTQQLAGLQEILQFAGTTAFNFNIFLPVAGGILLADRMIRDSRLGVDELITSTPLKRRTYILGKYAGGLLSVLTPVFLFITVIGGLHSVLRGQPEILLAFLEAFLAINLPAYAFITAFSLACPMVIPLRVYQVLFTGYWFWGNFLVPEVMPTLNGTLLTASGEFALFGFFGGWVGLEPGQLHTATDAVLNLGVLGVGALGALAALERFLAWRDSRV